MLIKPLPCVALFVDALNEALAKVEPGAKLTAIQCAWLVLVLTGIAVTGMLNFALFERRGLGKFTQDGLRWMFAKAQIGWSRLLRCSVKVVLAHYGVNSGTLVLDETDKRRAKVTKKIEGAHKVKDKKSGGYFNGQELVFLFLVTEKVSFPVDFRFYTPDPGMRAWKKRVRKQKKEGIVAAQREKAPDADPRYPSRADLAIKMLESFASDFPTFQIRGVLADALYGNASFMDRATAATRGAQVVSELRSNQLVQSRGSNVALKEYFARQEGQKTVLKIRGHKDQEVVMLGARLVVRAHGKKRFVVALRYPGETEYRFLVATDMSWRHTDIARFYTLRWLIEVFFEDWKAHGGWNRLTKHQGDDGSTRGVILSLLCDHMLLLHPEQSARLKNKQPGLPVGCMTERLKTEALIRTVTDVVQSENPVTALDLLSKVLREALPQRASTKHMSGLDLGRQEPTSSLRYRAAA